MGLCSSSEALDLSYGSNNSSSYNSHRSRSTQFAPAGIKQRCKAGQLPGGAIKHRFSWSTATTTARTNAQWNEAYVDGVTTPTASSAADLQHIHPALMASTRSGHTNWQQSQQQQPTSALSTTITQPNLSSSDHLQPSSHHHIRRRSSGSMFIDCSNNYGTTPVPPNDSQPLTANSHLILPTGSPLLSQPDSPCTPRPLVPEPIDCTEIEEYYADDNADYQDYVRRWEEAKEAEEHEADVDKRCRSPLGNNGQQGRSLFFGLQVLQRQQNLIKASPLLGASEIVPNCLEDDPTTAARASPSPEPGIITIDLPTRQFFHANLEKDKEFVCPTFTVPHVAQRSLIEFMQELVLQSSSVSCTNSTFTSPELSSLNHKSQATDSPMLSPSMNAQVVPRDNVPSPLPPTVTVTGGPGSPLKVSRCVIHRRTKSPQDEQHQHHIASRSSSPEMQFHKGNHALASYQSQPIRVH